MSLKYIFITFFVCLIGLSAFSNINVAQAQQAKIAVVDVEKILNDSKAGKSIQAQLKSRREAFQKEFAQRENDLMEAEKKLVAQKTSMNAEDFATRRLEFEKKLMETRNLFQKRRNSLDKGLGDALTSLRKNIIEVTAEVSDEAKYQMVVTRNSVVIVEKSMDITDEVLTRLNSKISNIKLDVQG